MKNFLSRVSSLRAYIVSFGLLLVSLALVSTLTANAAVYTQLTSSLDFGNQGVNVTNLQTFLADNPAIYPERLVTGYYGALTQAAVIRFQKQYGIDPVGRVGPITLAKINNLIA